MTPRQTALRLMAQTGTTVGHPDFVVAYLEDELARDRYAFHTPLQRWAANAQDVMDRALRNLAAAMRPIPAAFIRADAIQAGCITTRTVPPTAPTRATDARG